MELNHAKGFQTLHSESNFEQTGNMVVSFIPVLYLNDLKLSQSGAKLYTYFKIESNMLVLEIQDMNDQPSFQRLRSGKYRNNINED